MAERPDGKRYAFEVALAATKLEVKAAVEDKYGVHVQSVNTYIQRAERKRRYTKTAIIEGKTNRIKRAVVTLRSGQEIDLFETN